MTTPDQKTEHPFNKRVSREVFEEIYNSTPVATRHQLPCASAISSTIYGLLDDTVLNVSHAKKTYFEELQVVWATQEQKLEARKAEIYSLAREIFIKTMRPDALESGEPLELAEHFVETMEKRGYWNP